MSIHNSIEIENILEIVKQKIKVDVNFIANPTASNEELMNFETKYNVQLPLAYRRFVEEVSNGGEMDGIRLLPLSELEINQSNIWKPFPLKNYLVWGEDDIQSEDIMLNNNLTNGNIVLADFGCGITWNLIVKGESYGEMWNFIEVGVQSSYPKHDFLSWFNYWIENGDDFYADFDYEETNKTFDQLNKS